MIAVPSANGKCGRKKSGRRSNGQKERLGSGLRDYHVSDGSRKGVSKSRRRQQLPLWSSDSEGTSTAAGHSVRLMDRARLPRHRVASGEGCAVVVEQDRPMEITMAGHARS
jgi:hypothetical protein